MLLFAHRMWYVVRHPDSRPHSVSLRSAAPGGVRPTQSMILHLWSLAFERAGENSPRHADRPAGEGEAWHGKGSNQPTDPSLFLSSSAIADGRTERAEPMFVCLPLDRDMCKPWMDTTDERCVFFSPTVCLYYYMRSLNVRLSVLFI